MLFKRSVLWCRIQKGTSGMECEGWVGVSDVQNSKLVFKWFGKDLVVKNKAPSTTWNPPNCDVLSP